MYRSSQQVDHADERIIVSIASCSAFGCLKDAMKCFYPGNARALIPSAPGWLPDAALRLSEPCALV